MDRGCGDRERERLGVGWQAEDSRATRDALERLETAQETAAALK